MTTLPAVPKTEECELAVYDGRTYVGGIGEVAGRCSATAADGTDLGQFRTRKAAFTAISKWWFAR